MDFIVDQEIISGYTTDASNTTGQADALLRPKNVEELAEIVKNGKPISDTDNDYRKKNINNGVAPVPNGGWLISMEHFDTIHSLQEVDSGVILGEYQKIYRRTR